VDGNNLVLLKEIFSLFFSLLLSSLSFSLLLSPSLLFSPSLSFSLLLSSLLLLSSSLLCFSILNKNSKKFLKNL
jgi:hypothetical protein